MLGKENQIFFNQSFDKKRLKALISWISKKFGEAEALNILDVLKETGFHNATKAGISIGLHDLTTPVTKSWLISESQQSMNNTDIDFIGAKITATERSQRIIDTWHRASESLSKQVVDYFSIYDKFNPVYIMALSGARGNFSQVRQLIGMRGLMADQQGKIVNFPIRSNLREGLTITEYFISCSGARKGLVDTALRTADTGYLTRRLVDVSHHVVVKRIRCNTSRGIQFKDLQSYSEILLSLKDRLIGRVLAENISVANTLLAKKDTEISSQLSTKITQHRNKVFIRSPLTCGFTHEVCQLCYGWSISQGSLVSLGDAVGVIAAQSIGEPGTQLTMRTFHTGGVFSGDLLQEIRAPHTGTVEFSKAFQGLLIRTGHGRIAFLSKTPGSLILKNHCDQTNRSKVKFVNQPVPEGQRTQHSNVTTIPIQPFTMIFVRQNERVNRNQLLAEFSIQSKEGNQPIKTQQTIFAELSGRVIEDYSGKTYLKYLKEASFLVDNLQHSLSQLMQDKKKDVVLHTSGIDNETSDILKPSFFSNTNFCSSNTDLQLHNQSASKNSKANFFDESQVDSLNCSSLSHPFQFSKSQFNQSNAINQFLTLYKTEDFENDTFRYVEPVKAGRLGLLKILSTRISAVFSYTCPIKSSNFSNYSQTHAKTKLDSRFRSRASKTFLSPKSTSELRRPLLFKADDNKQVKFGNMSRILGAKSPTTDSGSILKGKIFNPYLHPEFVRNNCFFLQTIAEYGDIVEENYKNLA